MYKLFTILTPFLFIITNSYALEDPLNRASIDLYITDLSGNPLNTLKEGMQVLIVAEVTNNLNINQDCIVIFKISDSNNVIQLVFIKSVLNTNENSFSLSWFVEEEKEYSIEVFVWEGLDNPIPLAEKSVMKIDDMIVEIRERDEDNTNTLNVYTLEELKDYALSLINKDRMDHGLEPVELSDNIAAQKHAEDMLKYRYLAHWDSEGFKPYMRYLQYGGEGEVRENAGFIGYIKNYEKCSSGIVICEKIEPIKALEKLEYTMVYDDASSNWGHRDNILDKWHNKVSIGIAYDDYFLALVQHFENDYIDWKERRFDHNNFIIWKGSISVPDSLNFDSDTLFINSYYDPFPTRLNITELNNLPNCYTYGGGNSCNTNIVEVIMPELPIGYEYVDDVNTFSLSMTKTENSNIVDFTIKFKPVFDEEGLYTYVLYIETGEINEYLPLTSYTIVYKDGIKSLLDYINN